MLPITIQIISLVFDLILFIFLCYYLLRLRKKEQMLEKKQGDLDQAYHQTVDDALNKERQIITDATKEADRILLDTQLLTEESQASVGQTLEAMLSELKKRGATSEQAYSAAYTATLKQLTDQSLKEFQTISKSMQETLSKQIATFHDSLLPALEKELAAYKQTRMQETEAEIKTIVQRASQELLHKSISLEDHKQLLLEALEKAKQQGMFA